MTVGKRIFLKRNMPNKETIESYRKIPAANVCDALNRNCGMNPRIKLMTKASRTLCGPAYTVKTRAGDNLSIHAAMNFIGEGDVLVISNEGSSNRALMGQIMIDYLFFYKKIAGLIVDGPIRDIDVLKNYQFPIYATGTCPAGPYKDGPGEVNVPIACGEIPVNPGDIILADADGIVVIPSQDAEKMLPACQALAANDARKSSISRTGTVDRSWVTKLLEEKKYEVIDDIYKS